MPVLLGERQAGLSAREDVPQVSAARADEMLVGDVGVRVVALRASGSGHLEDLAHRHELVQGVVDRREADLREALLGAAVDGLGGEVDVLTVEDLGDGTSLRREPPIARPQALQ